MTFFLSEGDHGPLVNYFGDDYVWDENKNYLLVIPVDQRVGIGGVLFQNPDYEGDLSNYYVQVV